MSATTIPLVGPSNVLTARQFDREQSINLVAEATAPGTGAKVSGYVRQIPVVQPFATLPGAASIRGLFSQNGRLFAVGGSQFREVFEDGSVSAAIAVLEDNYPSTMLQGFIDVDPGPGVTSHGAILATSGGSGIVYDLVTNAEDQLDAGDLVPPYSMALFIDGYAVVLKRDSIQFNFSQLEDISVYSALDVSKRSEATDNISAICRSHREFWVLGERTSEVWYDDGVTPFSPIQGVFVEQGCVAPFSALNLDNTIFWLGQSFQGGQPIVYRANGYQPERISTTGIERYLMQSAQLRYAIGWSFSLQGHLFYGLYLADLPTTPVYDVSTQLWSEWARWDVTTGTWLPWFARCACDAFGKILIGDRSSSHIYEVTWDAYENTVTA